MPSIISTKTSGGGGIAVTGDTSGVLELASADGTTAVTISSSQRAAFVAGTAALPAITTVSDTNTGMYFPASDTIGFVEGGTEQMRLTDTGLLQFNSGYGSVATAYGCRAWVNFNGTGTVAIRGSGNVTSITDNGTGTYTVNFTTAMPDTNYALATSVGDVAGSAPTISIPNFSSPLYSTTQVKVQCWTYTGVQYDSDRVGIAVFR
jgi:hypothetical protein